MFGGARREIVLILQESLKFWRRECVFNVCVCSVVLKQRQQVVVVVVREVRRSEVRQQLIRVGQLRKQVQRRFWDIRRPAEAERAVALETGILVASLHHLVAATQLGVTVETL